MRRWGDVGSWSKRSLQVAVTVLACIPTATGLAGVIKGPGFLGLHYPWPIDVDSHFRFLSAIFLAIGFGLLSTVSGIERKTDRVRLLGLLIVAGGIGRAISLFDAGVPSPGHLLGLGLELAVAPILIFWQSRVASPHAPEPDADEL